MLRYSVRAVLSAAAMLGALAATASANVLVVDAFGGGNYTQIQAAVNAAVDGDTILIKSGTYGSFGVLDKELAIVGDAGSSVHVVGVIRARGLAAGKTLVLENLSAMGTPGNTSSVYGLYLSNNPGRVCVENCHFVGQSSINAYGDRGYDAIHVEGCSDVVLTRCTSLGGSAGVFHGDGNEPSGAGLYAQDSVVAIYDSTLQGGSGASANPNAIDDDGGAGGHGCWAISYSSVFVSGSQLVAGNGGSGGAGYFLAPAYGGDGGDGLRLEYASTAVLLDDVLVAGLGGGAGNGPESNPGDDGYEYVTATGSTLTFSPGRSRHLISSTPVRENTVAPLQFRGAVGEQVQLLISRNADLRADRTENGVLLLGGPIRIASMGVVPASGTLIVQFPVFALDPGIDSTALYMQARFIGQQGHSVLSGPSSMVILSHLF
jgi:hypothetical protein